MDSILTPEWRTSVDKVKKKGHFFVRIELESQFRQAIVARQVSRG